MSLRVISEDPLNAEAPLGALDGTATRVDDFYVRSNFSQPPVDRVRWRMRVHGAVASAITLSLADLAALPLAHRRMTLECAGNGRKLMTPRPPGTAWGLGAVGDAEFSGVALRDVLALAGVAPEAVECVFTGADGGHVEGYGAIRFQRSLPVDRALAGEPLLAWEMNGEPLAPEHGAPVRLVVPRWYAVASVKWLAEIELVDRPFTGRFQTDRYVYRPAEGPPSPVTTMRVRSLLTSHADGERLTSGKVELAGVAWSGDGPVVRVEVAVDDGDWHQAVLEPGNTPGTMARWRCGTTLPPGAHRIRVRATDGSGATQPERAPWNALGYGNNVVQVVRLVVS